MQLLCLPLQTYFNNHHKTINKTKKSMKTNTSLRLCLLLLTLCATMLHATEIKYGPNIVYDGKVNDAGQPFKKGKLITTYKASSNGMIAEEKDILEGEFNGGRVEKAKLRLARYNGPLWLNRAVFEGVVEYTIEEGGKSVTYKLLEGELKDNSFHKLSITPRSPMTITRQPGEDMGCATITTPVVLKGEALEVNERNLAGWDNPYRPLTLETLGVTGVNKAITYTLDKNFNLQKEEGQQLYFGEGKEVSHNAEKGYVYVKMANGDEFFFNQNTSKAYFCRQYTDATISHLPKGSTIKYANSNTFKGTIKIAGNQEPNALYKRIMQSSTLAEAGISIFTGEMTQADGQVVKYVEGLTEAEVQAARERREREAAEERARQEQEAAQRAAEAKRARAKLVGTWELLNYYSGIKIVYTLKADGTMTADYTYTHPQLKQGATMKFKTSTSWSASAGGFCVNEDGVDDVNININSTDKAYMADLNAQCNKFGRRRFLSEVQYEMIRQCDGGRSLAYGEKSFWDISISGTTMTATTNRRGEEVTVKFKKIK